MMAEDLVPAGQEDQVVQVTLVAQEASWGVLVEVVQEDQMADLIVDLMVAQMVDHLVVQMVDQEVGHSEGQCMGTHWQLVLEVASSD